MKQLNLDKFSIQKLNFEEILYKNCFKYVYEISKFSIKTYKILNFKKIYILDCFI